MVTLVEPTRAEGLVEALLSEVTGLQGQSLLNHLWPDGAPDAMDEATLAQHLAALDLELCEGYWHPSRALLSRAAARRLNTVLDWLCESTAPVPAAEVAARAIPMAQDCPAPICRVVIAAIDELLSRRAGFWRLRSGDWWVTPERLATEDRVRRLVASGAARDIASLETAIERILGLELQALTPDERQSVSEAFRERLPGPGADRPAAGQAEEAGDPDDSVVAQTTEPPPAMPRRSQVTLTADMIDRSCLKLPRGARLMMAAQGDRAGGVSPVAAVTVEGGYEVQGRLVDGGSHFFSNELFAWLSAACAEPGDRVVFYAPPPPGVLPHVALEPGRRPQVITGERKRTTGHLRERIVALLRESGHAMYLDDIVAGLQGNGEPPLSSSISATLSANSHLFVAWGRAVWGLREWGDDWSDFVSLQLLQWRIDDEDLVYQLVREAGGAITESDLANEIARRFRIRVELVRQVGFLRREDPRLHWDARSGLVSLPSARHPHEPCARYLYPHLVFMARHPDSERRICAWFQGRWGQSLHSVLQERGLTIDHQEGRR